MANRPSAVDLAYYSYILAIASAAVLVLTLLVGLIPIDALDFLGNIVWLALPLSAIGLAMALLARSEFRRRDPGADWWRKMRIGLRINGLALAFMVLLSLLVVALALIPGLGR